VKLSFVKQRSHGVIVKNVTQAIYVNGVLKPLEPLSLQEHQRVWLTVQPINGKTTSSREEALERLRAGIAAMGFNSGGSLPTREELHDRP
jgi:predicted DNA-binding antitoxin AbrB/MazE fold protein